MDIPFFCLSEPTSYSRNKERIRVDYLADLWNRCYRAGLEKYPRTTHILNTGSYYLHQISAHRQLVDRYLQLDQDIILAGNVWVRVVFPVPWESRYITYDSWAYPDLECLTPRFRPGALVQLDSVGLPMIHPVEAWRRHPFRNPEDLETEGIYYNQFCTDSKLPVLADLSIRFYRERGWIEGISGPGGAVRQLKIAVGRWRRQLLRQRLYPARRVIRN